MILNVSGRTDIVAFYSKWFMNRYKDGYLDVRNPFYKQLVSRIYFKDVDLIVFCTKNPIPMLDKIELINIPILFYITLTPYKSDIEPNVIAKNKIIDSIKVLSNKIGKENIYVRYDPLFISQKYSLDYHIKAFAKLCNLLNGYVNKIIISFLDNYKNVQKNQSIIKSTPLKESDYETIGRCFSKIAFENNMTVQTCFEKRNLVEYGFINSPCLSKELALKITGKKYKKWKARNCNCVEMVDIGEYNTCKHYCKYCYANYDEKSIYNNCCKHNPKSSLLIGELKSTDIIKIRK